jgi:hypothetical protein
MSRALLVLGSVILLSASGAGATAAAARISPTPSTLTFVRDRSGTTSVYSIDSGGKNLRMLRQPFSSALNHAWSPDGSLIAFTTSSGALAISDGHGVRVLRRRGYGGYGRTPVWSPDATRVAIEGPELIIEVIDVQTGKVRRVRYGLEPQWVDDATLSVAFREEEHVIDLRTGDERVLPDGVESRAWSPDGRLLAYWSEQRKVLCTIHRDWTQKTCYPRLHAPVGNTWTRSGDRLAAARDGIWTLDRAGHLRRIVKSESMPGWLAWSPDGRWLAFDQGEDGSRGIWIVRFDGAGLRRVITGGDNYGPNWVTPSAVRPFLGPPAKPIPPLVAREGRSALLTQERVLELTTDGKTVVALVKGRGQYCNHIVAWVPPAGSLRILKRSAVCSYNEVFGVAVSTPLIAWLEESSGGTHIERVIWTSDPKVGLGPEVAVRREGGDGSFVGHLVGSAGVLAFNEWESDGHITTRASLKRWDRGSRDAVVREGAEAIYAVDADDGNVLVAPGAGSSRFVYADDGTELGQLQVASDTRTSLLDGATVVTATATAVGVYDVASGTRTYSWPLHLAGGAPARLQDAHSGLAVYTSGSELHLLRLRDGREAVLRPPTQPVFARLAAGGLVYSSKAHGGAMRGRVDFVRLGANGFPAS